MRVITTKHHTKKSPDLSEFRRKYPLTVTGLAHLANREAWLHNMWQRDERLRLILENGTVQGQSEEVLVRGNPPSHLSVEGEFEVIYAGGTLGLFHAAVLSSCHKRSVLVFDENVVGKTNHDWNISDEELSGFDRAGLFTKDELETVVVNRYRSGFVKFHDANSNLKAPPLWVDKVLNVALDADELLSLAKGKLKKSETDSLMIDGLRFIRAYVTKEKVFVETQDTKTKQHKLFAAHLFVDTTGTNSPLAHQFNSGKSITHICPCVGTVAKGFVRGREKDEVDFNVGEILVSTEDASDNRQLMWKGFAGSKARDEYATYLSFYDAVDSTADKSLLNLFERYFESLHTYKRQGAQWRVVKPVFDFAPYINHQSWSNRKQAADDRVMLIGNVTTLSNPLTHDGFGSQIGNLKRLTHLTELAIKADMLDANALSQINADKNGVAGLSSPELMRPLTKNKPSVVNETMNAVMTALHSLDERIRREFFQDRMSFDSFKNLLKETMKVHPKIFSRIREHLGMKGSLMAIASIGESVLKERRAKKVKVNSLSQHENAKKQLDHYIKLYKAE